MAIAILKSFIKKYIEKHYETHIHYTPDPYALW
jgi:hypothetical protein